MLRVLAAATFGLFAALLMARASLFYWGSHVATGTVVNVKRSADKEVPDEVTVSFTAKSGRNHMVTIRSDGARVGETRSVRYLPWRPDFAVDSRLCGVLEHVVPAALLTFFAGKILWD